MASHAKSSTEQSGLKAIHINAEIHEQARREAFEERVPIRHVIHRYLCYGAGREDLMLQTPDPISAR